MNEDVIKKLMKETERMGSSYSEVRMENGENESFVLKNGVLNSYSKKEYSGVSLRVLVNGSVGFASTNIINKKSLEELVKTSIKIAKNSSRYQKEKIKLSKNKSYRKKYFVKEKIPLKNIELNEKIKYLIDVDKEALSSNVKLPGRYYDLETSTVEKVVATSDGGFIKSLIPRVNFTYIITSMYNNKSKQMYFQYGNAGGWEFVKKWEIGKALKEEAITLQKILKTAKTMKMKKVDAILGPFVGSIAAHESCGHPMEADRIMGREAAQAGESFVKTGSIGEKIGSEEATVIDDPTIPNSYGFYLFDDEGVKARPKILYKNGVINEFLHNRETAYKTDKKSNGSSRATYYANEPIVRMSNTYIKPGKWSFEELLKEVRNGIYIKDFMEWNIDDKRWNAKYVGNEAYLIKNGELKEMILNPVVEITTKNFWSSLKARGNDIKYFAGTCGKGDPIQGIPVFFGSPHILLKNILVGSRK
ncbi:MAG: TldD/PmbA family protein [Candidatus Aenigmarchaeota archaeon]|nr:TldD/PmbA family protein [Candidatus Aenigmarchaeota archaeon]